MGSESAEVVNVNHLLGDYSRSAESILVDEASDGSQDQNLTTALKLSAAEQESEWPGLATALKMSGGAIAEVDSSQSQDSSDLEILGKSEPGAHGASVPHGRIFGVALRSGEAAEALNSLSKKSEFAASTSISGSASSSSISGTVDDSVFDLDQGFSASRRAGAEKEMNLKRKRSKDDDMEA